MLPFLEICGALSVLAMPLLALPCSKLWQHHICSEEKDSSISRHRQDNGA